MKILNNRIEWVDIFKALAILSVVIGHSGSPLTIYVYLFHVPAFFFISGFTTSIEKESITGFIVKKFRTIMIPFFSINFFFLVLTAILTDTRIGKFLNNPIHFGGMLPLVKNMFMYGSGTEFGGATWFLYVLFEATVLVKIVFTVCQQVAKKTPEKNLETWLLAASSILLWLLGYYLYATKQPVFNYSLDLCLNAQLYFVLGLFFRKYTLFEKSKKIIFVPVALFGMYYFSNVSWIMMNWPTRAFAPNPLHDVFSALSGIYLIYVLSTLFLGIKYVREALIYLGTRSLVVLAFHFLGMKLSYFIFYTLKILPYEQLKQFVPPGNNNYWHILVVTSALFSLAVEFVLARNQYLAALFLGKNLVANNNLFELLVRMISGHPFVVSAKQRFSHWWNEFNLQEEAGEPVSLYSPPSKSKPAYLETFLVVAVLGLIIFIVNKQAFDGFFLGEDFNITSLYLFKNKDFFGTIFDAIFGVFFRPASMAWLLITQLILPWNPVIHHLRNYLFTLLNLFLIYRIMIRVTSSKLARMVGISFFALSKVHLSTIGFIAMFEHIITLTHFLFALLFTIRYLQERKKRDYLLALVFFALSVFSRDFSVVLLAVIFVLFFFYAYEKRGSPGIWRDVFFKFSAFLAVAIFYLAMRFWVVGLPKTGSDTTYAINFNLVNMAKYVLLFAGNIMNVSITRTWFHTIGRGDLSTLFFDYGYINWAYKLAFLAAGSWLLFWTVFKGVMRRTWISFSLVWAIIIATPTFLINRPYIHYILEPVAAIALLLALSLDFVAPERKKLLRYWLILLVLIGLNAIGHNQNVEVYAWRWAQNALSRINQQIFIPNKGLHTRSLTIVAPDEPNRALVAYVIAPFYHSSIENLMETTPISFIAITRAEYAVMDQTQLSSLDLVYSLKPLDYTFTRLYAKKPGMCNSFETNIDSLHTIPGVNSLTEISINKDPAAISDGQQSVRITVHARGQGPNYSGGIELPLPVNNAFSIDLWIDKPQDVSVIYANEVDISGKIIHSWENNNPAGTIQPGELSNLNFILKSGNTGGFDWNAAKPAGNPTVIQLVFDVKKDKDVNFYIDQFCRISETP
jgi:fucose 4-O-acetylase-like acetyltransferase